MQVHNNGTNKTEVENSPEWALYRKKNGLDKKIKLFICKQYGSFKKALL